MDLNGLHRYNVSVLVSRDERVKDQVFVLIQ